jgi:AraC-like DNA-binding protein
MQPWEFPRNVTSMRLTAEMAAEEGVPLRDSLAGTGVAEIQLHDPDCLVSGQQELRLIRNVLSRLPGRTALGVRAGARYHFTAYGALGLALVSSRTARSALELALQHFNLTFAFVRFVVSDTKDETRIVVDDGGVPEDVAAFVVERAIAALATVGRGLGVTKPLLSRLELRAPRPADLSGYEKFFRLSPHFGAAQNAAVLERAGLEQPLRQANESTRAAALALCRQLLEARKVRAGLAHTVRSRLAGAPSQMPTMEAVAGELLMTPRTLRRRLLEEGTSFAELRDEVRQTLADEFLKGPRLSIEQIAERLGYAEPTSFINAYKRWYGRTPHAGRLGRADSLFVPPPPAGGG